MTFPNGALSYLRDLRRRSANSRPPSRGLRREEHISLVIPRFGNNCARPAEFSSLALTDSIVLPAPDKRTELSRALTVARPLGNVAVIAEDRGIIEAT